MRKYEMGNEEIDAAVAALVAQADSKPNQDLAAEIIITALKLYRDGAERGDLKLVNTALKEMRYSMLVFSRDRHRPKVTMYGSARTPNTDIEYQLAKRFAEVMVERSWAVITGAGPGIMEAGNEGAGMDASYGVNIRLPFESNANPFVSPDRLINFKYFFTRKLGFVKESSAFALFPGGFGTMDEAFELLTLTQTGKSDLHPIVMVGSEQSTYWERWNDFVVDELVGSELIAPEDQNLYLITDDPIVAADEICHFYANYRSQRYVDGKLVLRVTQGPTPDQLAELNDQFGDILASGTIESVEPSNAEVRDGDDLEASRLQLHFDRRHYGRLRSVVNMVNDWVATPEIVHPGTAFTDEQQDRPW